MEAIVNLEENDFIQKVFDVYMNSSTETVADSLRNLVSRIEHPYNEKSEVIADLMLRLYSQYPDDIGVFAPLMLNYLTMKAGESFFIGPNVPHAYIFGDCVECMALSDNVVRAGLTPKLRDVETLMNMLEYRAGAPSFIQTFSVNDNTQIYR